MILPSSQTLHPEHLAFVSDKEKEENRMHEKVNANETCFINLCERNEIR